MEKKTWIKFFVVGISVIIIGLILFCVGWYFATEMYCRDIIEDGQTIHILMDGPYHDEGYILINLGIIFLIIGPIITLISYYRYKIISKREIDDFNKRWE